MSHTAFTINVRKLNSLLFLLLLMGGILYFFTVNNLSTSGFAFKELKEKVGDLQSDQQRMESQITLLGSYQNLNPRIQELKLVEAKDVSYISSDSFMVARK